jgi:hypothetical protein
VQAQDYGAAKWGVGQRVEGCTDGDVDRAFDAGRIHRTHVMRPTRHIVAPAAIRWLLELTAPRVHAANAFYYRSLGLDDSVFAAANAAIAEALEGGEHLTRNELAERLAQVGIEAAGPRLAYLLMRAELDALVCSGSRRGKQHTYALLEERAPGAKALGREEGLAELAGRYFTSHGPALPQDFAKWSGLTIAEARHAVEFAGARLSRQKIGGAAYWSGREPPAGERTPTGPVVHLLPNYDEYLIAYRDYGPVAATAAARQVAPRGLFDRHIVLVDGQLRGGWSRTLGKQEATVEARLPTRLDAATRTALAGAVEHYGRFLQLPAALRIDEPAA